MAVTVSLATYTIRVRDREGKEYLPLDDFFGNDLLDIFKAYLDDRADNVSDDEDRQRLLRATQAKTKGRTVAGILEAGEYGYQSELFNVDSRKISYKRKPSDAELLPFYFLLSVPKGSDRGILILERFRQYGIRSAFWNDFNAFFDPYLGDVSLQLNPLVPAGLIEEIRRGTNVKSIRFIHFGLPSDLANALGAKGPIREEEGILEYVVKARRGGRLPLLDKVSAALKGEASLSQLTEFTGFDFNQVKVQLEIDGRTRTMNLSDPEGVRAQYDVSNEVELDEATGHPTEKSIDRISREILKELEDQLGL